jgi:hypothetical protein
LGVAGTARYDTKCRIRDMVGAEQSASIDN